MLFFWNNLITKDRWTDFERHFESKVGPHNCWCTVLREVENKDHKPDKIEKKVTVKKRVDDGIPIGILAYSDNEPFAWCSIALGLNSNCFNSTILL